MSLFRTNNFGEERREPDEFSACENRKKKVGNSVV